MKVKLTNEKEFEIESYEDIAGEPKVKLVIKDISFEEIKENFTIDNLKDVQIIGDEGGVNAEYFNYELCQAITQDYTKYIIYIQLQSLQTLISTLNDQVVEANALIEKIRPSAEVMEKLVSTTITTSDKSGYNWKITSIGNVEVLKEYIKADEDEDAHDGSDYTKPAYYVVGSSVEKGKWYCQESDTDLRYECIRSGTPSSFFDNEYFDIIAE